MSSPPKVSVLIPTFNYARYLPEAIESVLQQDFGDFELLISDDASADGSAGIVRGYAARDRRIRAQVQPRNLGMVANWNWCLHEARGDYVKFVFGDDRLVGPHALRTLAARLDAAPGAVMAASARQVLDEQSRAIAIWDELKTAGTHPGAHLISHCLRHNRNLIGEPSAVMLRRAAAARGFDPRYKQVVDLELWMHLLRSGDLVYEPEALCAFRRHPLQQTVQNRRDGIGPLESLQLLSSYLDFLDPPGCAQRGLPSSHRTLYRNLHYARKHAPRTPEVRALERHLHHRIAAPWYFLYGLEHRLTKPFHNFSRAWRRLVDAPDSPPGMRPLRPTLPGGGGSR
jgi:glycosyltransferase involved in cell wall biosynthesis